MPFFTLIGYANETLLISNLFIFLYNNALRLLNLIYPQSIPSGFIRTGALPEPFEIPLYLLFSVASSIAILFFHINFKKRLPINLHPFLKCVAFIFLLSLFITNLGMYPLAHDTYPYQTHTAPQIYLLVVTIYIVLISAIIYIATIFSDLITRSKINLLLFFCCLISLVGILTLEPRFPILGHDYSFFFGPIWEVLHGKTLYNDIPSQYGFLSILTLSLFHQIGIVNIIYLPMIIWFLYCAEYFICFYLLYRLSDSITLSLIGLFSVITINYYSIYHLPASVPQTGPMRWLPLILSLLVLYKTKRFNHPFFIFTVALATFWVLDSGIALVLAFGFSIFLLFLQRFFSFKQISKIYGHFFLTTAAIYISINLFLIFLGYKFINPAAIFLKFSQYSRAGFGMIPMESFSHIWFVILVYFASLVYFFRKRNRNSDDFTLLFAANLSLFASTYFIGRSHPHNLFHISLFPILNIFILLGLTLKDTNQIKRVPLLYIILSILFIVYPAYNRQEVMTEMIREKIKLYKMGEIFTPEWPRIIIDKYKQDVAMIHKNISDKRMVILSPDDTYLFYLVNKENLLYDNSQITILTNKDLDRSLRDVYKICPKKIVTDCTLLHKCEDSKPFTEVSFSIQPIILNRMQDKCKTTYISQQCVGSLCIAISNKMRNN